MTHGFLPLTILLVGLAASPLPPAQQPGELDWDSPVHAHELEIAYYSPRWTTSMRLRSFAAETHLLEVIVIPAESAEAVFNHRSLSALVPVEDLILVRGSKAQVGYLMTELQRLDEALRLPVQESARAAELVEFEYAPRFIEAGELYTALARFQRRVDRAPAEAQGKSERVDNMSLLATRGLILVQETAERAAEIQDFLERLDRPEPQVTVHYLMLRAGAEAEAGNELPAELAEHLRALVPFPHFRVLNSGLLRGSTRRTMQIRQDPGTVRRRPPLEPGDGDASMHLELEPASFDPASRTLTLRRCSFDFLGQEDRRSFETSAALVAGEHTVIGAAGRDPILLVLRLSLE